MIYSTLRLLGSHMQTQVVLVMKEVLLKNQVKVVSAITFYTIKFN